MSGSTLRGGGGGGGGSAGTRPGMTTLTLMNGRVVPAADVVDFALRFVVKASSPYCGPLKLGMWQTLVGGSWSVEETPWRVPHGLPLEADDPQGNLLVKPGFDLYVTNLAVSHRALSLRLLDFVGPERTETVREFSGPKLVEGIAPIPWFEICGDRRKGWDNRLWIAGCLVEWPSPPVLLVVDVSCLLVDCRGKEIK